ncbi:WLM domain-containing protein [Rhypophila decipiens]|uniref:WLM domain-containing protein n=1 Tax=Rhypophila decipiens TaxID=261697 RepID=A0AAN7BCL6_9PEZI|nr:WLM domain-containing protein [Rhypophila decipiens]
MAEHDPHILSYSHLREFPREKEALHSLKKIASLVKPLMRARGWKVNELAEFYPDQANLLGLNQNKTLKILLRLRYPGDKTQFMPLEQVVDTMLHELAHIVHGPHDEKFHALWNKLREEYEALIRKGYTGERFLSEGHRLGGSSRRLPMHEARRLARAAAEQRKRSGGSGQRLGGAAPRPGEDIRRVIVDAVERRNRALKGCGNTNHSEREIRNISDQATQNGFKTKAEEDAANETAIAQALWELVQEDEKQKFGSSYVEPSAQNPAGDMFPDGDKSQDQTSLTKGESSKSSSSSGPPPVPAATRPNQRPTASAENEPLTWTCQICTLVNKADFLCCAACENERSTEVSVELSKKDGKRPNTREVVDLTGSSPVRKRTKEEKKTATGGSNRPSNSAASSTWTCSFCGRKMDSQWWTCATCARLKDSS